MKRIIIIGILASCAIVTFAQKKLKNLDIDDICPDAEFVNMLNYPKSKLRLTDFKNKMVILDFMGTSCASCIAAFPHLESLQKQFAGKLQIIVVTKNTKQEWENLAKRNQLTRELKLPVILHDSILSNQFKHEYVPHEVWLSGNSIVKAITTAQYLTPENVAFVLSGRNPDWIVKRDLGEYAFDEPFLELKHSNDFGEKLYYTTVTSSRIGTIRASKTVSDSNAGYKKFTLINWDILALYKYALQDSIGYLNNNRVILEVKDLSKYRYDDKSAYKNKWQLQNSYCYEAIVPLATKQQELNEFLIQDVNRYFDLYARLEKRTIPAYVLKWAGIDSNPLQYISAITASKTFTHHFKSIKELTDALDLYQAFPFIDETGIAGSLLLGLNANSLKNAEQAKNELAVYGINMIKQDREFLVWVITEK